MMTSWNGLTFCIIGLLCVVSLWIPSAKGQWCTVVVISLLLAWVSICTNSRIADEIRHSYDVTLKELDESELLVTFSLINIHMSEMVEVHLRERPRHALSAQSIPCLLMPWRHWCPGDWCRQGISKHGVDLVPLKYCAPFTWRLKPH